MVFKHYMNGIVQNISLCIWLPTRNTMFARVIPFGGILFFFCILIYHIPLYEHANYLFILLLMDILSSLQFGTITYHSATNIFVYVSWCTSSQISVGYKPKNGTSRA